jgi:hypothetical protein
MAYSNGVIEPFISDTKQTVFPLDDKGMISRFGGIVPLLVYKDEYDDDIDAFKKVANLLHNVLHLRFMNGKHSGGVNKLSNYQAYAGILNAEDYYDNTHPYGEEGNSPLKDYAFFDTNIESIRGMLLGQPFQFDVKTVNSEAGAKKIDLVSQSATEGFMRKMAEKHKQTQGVDLEEAMTDKSIYVPTTEEERLSFLTGKGQIEQAVLDMMQYTLWRYRLDTELADCFRDKGIVNREFGEVFMVANKDISFRRLHPKQVSWIGDENIADLADADAVGVTRYIHLNTAIQSYGHLWEDTKSEEALAKSIQDVVAQKPISWQGEFSGSPDAEWMNEEGFVQLSMMNGYLGLYQPIDAQSTMLCEQKMYFKMIRRLRFRLMYNSKPMSKDEYKDYKKGKIDACDVDFVKVEKDYKETKSEVIVYRPIVELYQSTRLGANLIVDLRKCPITYRDRTDPVNVIPPVVGYVGKDRSMVTKGLPLQEMYNGIIRVVRKQVNMLGINALAYDLSKLPDGYDLQRVLYEGKEVGLVLYNSKQTNGQPTSDDHKHLTKVEMGSAADIAQLLNLAALVHETYDAICGVTPSMKGVLQDRQGIKVTEAALSQGNLVLMSAFKEHRDFVQNVLQIIANYGKHVWPKEETRSVIVGKAGLKVLRLSQDMPNEQYGIFLTDGYQAQQDKQVIMSMADRALSSGAASMPELLELVFEDNPARALSIFKQGMSTMARVQAQQQELIAQAESLKAQVEQQKVQIPIQVAQIQNEGKLQVEQMRIDAQQQNGSADRISREDAVDVNNAHALQMEAMRQQNQQQPQPVQ